MERHRLISIIVPVWRAINTERNCFANLLESITNSIKTENEIIAVCNSQDPETVEFVRQSPDITRYCLNNVNVGVSRGWNLGSHLAEGEFLCFINEDVILGPGTLEALAQALESRPKVAVAGVEGANFDLTAEGKIIQRQRLLKGPAQYCDAVSGFLFMVKAGLLHRLGGFDDTLTPCSYEEMDFALRVRAAGLRSFIVPGLSYSHPWGISSANPRTVINFMGHSEKIDIINKRNRKLLISKWIDKLPIMSVADEIDFKGKFYNEEYFAQNNYVEIMTKPRFIWGKEEQPLAKTLADMVDAVAAQIKQPCRAILEIGCAYGFAVQELIMRGYEAYGVDLSEHCIVNSPVPNRVSLADVKDLPADKKYDIVIAANLFEHISDKDLVTTISNVSNITDVIFTIINKGTHDPSHINIKTNWDWIKFLKENGFFYEPLLTRIARMMYLKNSNGKERWQRDCLIFTKRDEKDIFLGLNWKISIIREWLLDMNDVLIKKIISMRDIMRKYLR